MWLQNYIWYVLTKLNIALSIFCIRYLNYLLLVYHDFATHQNGLSILQCVTEDANELRASH